MKKLIDIEKDSSRLKHIKEDIDMICSSSINIEKVVKGNGVYDQLEEVIENIREVKSTDSRCDKIKGEIYLAESKKLQKKFLKYPVDLRMEIYSLFDIIDQICLSCIPHVTIYGDCFNGFRDKLKKVFIEAQKNDIVIDEEVMEFILKIIEVYRFNIIVQGTHKVFINQRGSIIKDLFDSYGYAFLLELQIYKSARNGFTARAGGVPEWMS